MKYHVDDDVTCPHCKGSRKVYPEHARGELVALDTVPGYDPRILCPWCADDSGAITEEPTA